MKSRTRKLHSTRLRKMWQCCYGKNSMPLQTVSFFPSCISSKNQPAVFNQLSIRTFTLMDFSGSMWHHCGHRKTTSFTTYGQQLIATCDIGKSVFNNIPSQSDMFRLRHHSRILGRYCVGRNVGGKKMDNQFYDRGCKYLVFHFLVNVIYPLYHF